MASILQVGGKWRALVRRKGHPSKCKTFRTKAQAQSWARDIESRMDGSKPALPAGTLSVSRLIQTYRELREASRPILDASNEHYMLNHLEEFLGEKVNLIPQDLVEFCKWRKLEGAGPYTLNMEVSKLGTVLRYSASALAIVFPDVVGQARPLLSHLGLIGGGGKRERRPTDDELVRIYAALPDPYREVVRFMVATAMRRGEVCRLRWDDLDREKRLILVRNRKDPRRKTGNDQWVPLIGEAWEIVIRLRPQGDDAIFFHHPQTLSKIFKATCDALGIPDLHLHDLRHHAISLMFERGMAIHEVALVSGHSDWKHLKRYTNLRPEDLHRKFSTEQTGRSAAARPLRKPRKPTRAS